MVARCRTMVPLSHFHVNTILFDSHAEPPFTMRTEGLREGLGEEGVEPTEKAFRTNASRF